MGVEEEFVLVDRHSRQSVRRAREVVRAAKDAAGAEHVEPEMAQAQVENVSAVCHTAAELHAEVTRLRGSTAAEAARAECLLVPSGTAVLGDVGPPPILDKPRYHTIERRFGPLVRQQCVNACHVHIGVRDREESVQVVNHLRVWTPLLLALSVNSPFCAGEDTGYASWRSMVWGRWPTCGPPPYLESAAHYEHVVGSLVDSGAAVDGGMLYWHVRPSRHVPTVEMRVADVLPDVRDTVAYALLVRALAAACLDSVRSGARSLPVPEAVLRAASWRAARYGMNSLLLATHRPAPVLAPAWSLVRELVASVLPHLERHGDSEIVRRWLELVHARGTGAERQRAVARRHGGDLRAVVDDLAVAPSPPDGGVT
ncbi:carboxylate-amine ligase [Streptoalloteichus hindustanus]|uniref:Putative glutamate--cysteine ligase 2 n=1 Tax=Streptoalloteichus hindustanus TaxID=2017 RepID=A0A1M5FAR7_STRHI|nr:glutamate--cysteine ligase [Streptoalloteichus hindustanus]SHF88508.1 carboxylate-amine ligase [Streptoalloteichus hindustanus]